MKKIRKPFPIYDIVYNSEDKDLEEIDEKYSKEFYLGLRLLKCGYDVFPIGESLKNNVSAHVERTLLSLYTKSFRLYRAVLILCKSGLGYEALIELRSLLDTCSYIFYISEKDHDERLLHYLHSIALSWDIAIKDFVETYPESEPQLNVTWYKKKYEDAINYFRDKHGKDKEMPEIRKSYALKPETAAQALKDFLPKQYKIFFRYASFVAHGQDVLNYIFSNSKHKFYLKITPLEDFIKFCMKEAMVFFLLIMDRINEILNIGKDIAIKNIDEELKQFLKTDKENGSELF